MSRSTWLEIASVSLEPACGALLSPGLPDGPPEVERWRVQADEAREAPRTTRRRFWCRHAGRDVDVSFATRGILGLRVITQVRTCTAFDPPTAVACDRRCVEPGFRQAWEPPPPFHSIV